jgi:glycosyltransferase involved in cell wall biosynthesis
MPFLAVIIPCYNEAGRLQSTAFLEMAEINKNWHLYFVNDGSTDSTSELLDSLLLKNETRIHVLHLPVNKGKGEAIRHGAIEAYNAGFQYIAYLDADLATPFKEFERLVQLIGQNNASIIFGSRIKKAGTIIKRSAFRHIAGRAIATFIDLKFDLGIYDTQCGSKIFKASVLKEAIDKPFFTTWLFDVEIFIRLKHHQSQWHEEPLLYWENKADSKLHVFSFPLVCKELATLIAKY